MSAEICGFPFSISLLRLLIKSLPPGELDDCSDAWLLAYFDFLQSPTVVLKVAFHLLSGCNQYNIAGKLNLDIPNPYSAL